MIENCQFNKNKKTAVVLLQLGGPSSLEAVEPFLYNLFSDSYIFDYPGSFALRKIIALLISKIRSKKVINYYNQIGGKSPILEISVKQSVLLQEMLYKNNLCVDVFCAMRYWHPLIKNVLSEVKLGNYEQIILLPLYPQYSKTTTMSAIAEWNTQAKKQKLNVKTKFVKEYYNHQLLIDAYVENINEALNNYSDLNRTDVEIIFSAHGIPEYIVKQGDPYKNQIENTVKNILDTGKWNNGYSLCYQSKIGPLKWLAPSLIETVKKKISEEKKYLLIAPISFVSDNLETLYEINIDLRRIAEKYGALQLEIMPALNTNSKFISCLSQIAMEQYEK